jgi:archaellum biogenesis ATPase FlaH
MSDNDETIRILKESLMIIDKLAECEFDDVDDIEELILKAKKIKKNKLWRLK